jgi:FG-GAP-like repeat/Abnormal spindle-like microcephaly-assoc'd, ASPM-SPD-2-Hydin/FG-GAP repeat
MKSRMLVLMSAITLAALATPIRTPAQEAPRQAEDSSNDTGATNPVPLIYQPLVPDTKIPGAAGFTLTVNGTGFVSGATVNWNGRPLATTFVSGARLTATVPASDIAKAESVLVTVANPGPGGGSSNPVFFLVSKPVDLSFRTSAFSAGSGPGSVATGDFNGDGKLDLIVPDTGSGDVSVLLGNGGRTFRAPISYSVGQGASPQFFQVAVADLNGDGKLDFVVSDFVDNYVSVFIGNGDGTFKPGIAHAVGTNPTSVAVADVNGDGKPDLVISNQNCPNRTCGKATVSILLGNGDGTFEPQSDYAAGKDANWVVVGDFNGDGKLDLAVVNGQGNKYTSAVVILLGNGDGTFRVAGSYPLNTNAVSGATGDFNGDGKLDIAIADNVGVVSILLGNGDGTFQPRVDYSAGCGLYCSFPWGSISVGDFNQDGDLDLAVSNGGESSISVFLGNGDGTFEPEMEVATGSASGSVLQGVVAGDFTQSGRLDFAVANEADNNVSILLQNGTVSFSPARLNFGVQLVGSGSTNGVTLANLRGTALTISGIAITGLDAADFTQSNTCGSSLGAGQSCTISVTFTPRRRGSLGAAITISDTNPSSPQTVPLSGTGVTSGPNATLSPTSLTFATQLIGTTSRAQVITLSNYGAQTLTFAGMSINVPFKQTHTCDKNLPAGASCTIDVTFTPKAKGSFNGTLSITDNAPDSPQAVSLSGAGTEVEFNPSSLSFSCRSTTPGGCRAPSKKIKLTNKGATALSITSIAIPGYSRFSQTNNCIGSVGAGGSCSITVIFSSSSPGTLRRDLVVVDNGGSSPQRLALSGTATLLPE